MSKVKLIANQRNMNRQIKLREALSVYGVSAGMSWNVWTHGVTSRHDYYVVYALMEVLAKPAGEILEDPENLLPKKGK